MNSISYPVFEFGSFRLDPLEKTLCRGADLVSLTPTTFNVLQALVENHGRLLEKDALLKMIWQERIVEEGNLTRSISTLRKLLEDDPDRPTFIQTAPRRGYRFVADVRAVLNGDALKVEALAWSRITVEQVEEVELPDKGLPAEEPDATTRSSVSPIIPVSTTINAVLQKTRQIKRVGFVGLGVLVWSLWLVRPPVQSGQVRIARVPGTSRAVVAAISAEGRYAVHGVDVGGEQSLWLREVAARSERQLVAGSSVDYWSVTFSPDSMYVYYVAWPRNRRDAGLYRVPVRGGTPQQLYEDSGRVVHLSPDGKRLAWVNSVASIGFILYVANSDGSGTKGLVIRPQSSPFSEKAVAWSADGKLITCTVRNKELDYEVLTSFRLEDGMEQPISSPKWKEIASMAWLPDGSGLLLAAREQHSSEASKEHSSAPSTQLWFLSYPGGKAHRLTNDFLDYSALSLTRDGNTVSAIARSSRSAVWVAPASQPASGKRVTGKTDNGTGLHRRVGLDL